MNEGGEVIFKEEWDLHGKVTGTPDFPPPHQHILTLPLLLGLAVKTELKHLEHWDTE